MTKPWILSRKNISKTLGLKVIQLNLTEEAREALNAHVPDLEIGSPKYAPRSRTCRRLLQRLNSLGEHVRRAMKRGSS
jgi:hypothetical protein